MRAVLFGPAYPFRGGVPLFTTTLAIKLREAGHEAHVVNYRQLFPQALFRKNPQTDESSTALQVSSERLFTAWNPGTWSQSAAAIARCDPDLILAQWWQPLFAFGYCGVFRALPTRLRQRWISVVHDVVSFERWPGDRLCARAGLSCANRYLCLSRYEAKRLQHLLPRSSRPEIHVSFHPDYDAVRDGGESQAEARRQLGITAGRVLLFFGFVRRYKGLDILLQAMPHIARNSSNLQLLVAGPFHDSRERYVRLLNSLSLRSSVIIQDRYFSGSDAIRCFAAADVVVLPYRTASQSGVIPMARALGVPAIVTDVGSLAESVEDGQSGLVVAPNNPEALANAVRRFYEQGGRAAFSEGVRQVSLSHSWPGFITNLEQLIP